MHLPLSTESLIIFVDDTGHEALVKEQPVYGLGGCAIPGAYLDSIIRNPWRRVREQVVGSPDSPLHASAFGQSATHEHIEIVVNFFSTQQFARLGAIITAETALASEMDAIQTIAAVLQLRIWRLQKGSPLRICIIFYS